MVKNVGVFRRIGNKQRANEMIWVFAKFQKLPKKLGWERRAGDLANKWLSENITQAFLKSLPKKP